MIAPIYNPGTGSAETRSLGLSHQPASILVPQCQASERIVSKGWMAPEEHLVLFSGLHMHTCKHTHIHRYTNAHTHEKVGADGTYMESLKIETIYWVNYFGDRDGSM